MSNPPLLTTSQLFTPAASGVLGAGVVPGPNQAVVGTWLASEYTVAAEVGLSTTAWQPGGPERSIFAVMAVLYSQDDAIISGMAQGGFLDSAATGSVTYQTLNGTQVTVPVTPAPSNPAQNPTGAPGWLDDLGQNVYDTFRLPATFAAGQLALVNVSASTAGPYLAGAYHVANRATGATYANTASLTVPTSSVSNGTITGITPGLTSTIIQTSGSAGITAGQTIYVNLPTTSGISGLAGVFATVTTASGSLLTVPIGSSGTYTSGGTVYLCTVANFQADIVGTGSNAAPGTVTTTITQANGVSVSNVAAWSGSTWESNTAYAARCRLALAAASPNGPSQAYVYFAETAVQILAAEVPPYTLTNGPVIANEFAPPATGVVTTVVASTTPVSTTLGAAVTPGSAQNPVVNATAMIGHPIVIQTANPHGIPGTTGDVIVSGIRGLPEANGAFVATVVDSTHFSIPILLLNTYTGGGSVEAGDLGLIDNLLQENVVPDGTSAITESALAFPITITGTVTVPQAYVTQYQAAVLPALIAYLAGLPIGGLTPGAPTVGVDYDEVIAALGEAGVFMFGQPTVVKSFQAITVAGNSQTLTGPGDIAFPACTYQALLAGASAITVVGV